MNSITEARENIIVSFIHNVSFKTLLLHMPENIFNLNISLIEVISSNVFN